MTIITVKPLYHQGMECIGIHFPFDESLTDGIKTLKNVRWSQMHSCWYVPFTNHHYQALRKHLGEGIILNTTCLNHYIQRRKVLLSPGTIKSGKISSAQAAMIMQCSISDNNLKALQNFLEQLKLKAYSSSTIRTYRYEFIPLLNLLKQRDVCTLTIEEVRKYILYCIEKQGLSESAIHSRINALKFYFEKVLKMERKFFELPRPKKPILLPKVLGERELGRLFNALTNRKHKVILFTAYSAGLRVSEAVNLKISHVDSSRMQLFIQRAKGKKDRYVGLSPILLDVLRSYIKECKPRPQIYLFEGFVPGTPYTTKSAQRIFQMAKKSAGIQKEVSFHVLRHSFATHLLEKGVDIRYIKDLLGHFSIKTTERYLHVKKDQLVRIVSPLDNLWEKEKIHW